MTKKMSELEFIIEVETEGFDETNPDHITGIQGLVDSGLVWHLQGSWQKFATRIINAGLVVVNTSPQSYSEDCNDSTVSE